jgi:hypothetical protein
MLNDHVLFFEEKSKLPSTSKLRNLTADKGKDR